MLAMLWAARDCPQHRGYQMRTILIALASLVAVPAMAADMPVKAPKLIQAYPSSSGWYWDVGAYGEATKLGITSPIAGPTSTFAAGGNLSIGGGYVYALSATRKIALEGSINYANTGAKQAGVDFSSKISGTQRLLYIGDSSMLTRWLPDLSLVDIFPAASPLPLNAPMCPIGQTCNPLTMPYIGAVLREAKNEINMAGLANSRVRITYGATFGLMTPLADGSAVDTWTSVTSSSGAHLSALGAGGIVAHEGVTYQAGMTYKFGVTKN